VGLALLALAGCGKKKEVFDNRSNYERLRTALPPGYEGGSDIKRKDVPNLAYTDKRLEDKVTFTVNLSHPGYPPVNSVGFEVDMDVNNIMKIIVFCYSSDNTHVLYPIGDFQYKDGHLWKEYACEKSTRRNGPGYN
jgi:hypothetical protein